MDTGSPNTYNPGYKGKLFIGLFNPFSESVVLDPSQPFLTVQFFRLENPASHPYDGPFQGFKTFPEDDIIRMTRMTRMNTPTLADVAQSVGILETAVRELKDSVKGIQTEMRWSRTLLMAIFAALVAGLVINVLPHLK